MKSCGSLLQINLIQFVERCDGHILCCFWCCSLLKSRIFFVKRRRCPKKKKKRSVLLPWTGLALSTLACVVTIVTSSSKSRHLYLPVLPLIIFRDWFRSSPDYVALFHIWQQLLRTLNQCFRACRIVVCSVDGGYASCQLHVHAAPRIRCRGSPSSRNSRRKEETGVDDCSWRQCHFRSGVCLLDC